MEFTVIIPAYNREHFIAETLDSIIAQTYAPAEIIVVDDGSTDRTVEIVKSYGDAVKLITIANSGAAAARHYGALVANSDYIAFCDSDDIWKPKHLANLATLLSIDSVDFAFSDFRHFTSSGDVTGTHFEGDKSGFWTKPGRRISEHMFVAEEPLFPHILDYQALFQSCFAMRKERYMQVGGYDASFGRMVSEDLEFALRCVRFGNTGICTSPTVRIRRHDGNHSADWIKCLFGSIDILRYSAQHHDLPNEWRLLIAEQVTQRSLHGIDVSFLLGRLQDTRRFGKNLDVRSVHFKQQLKLAIAALPMPVSQFFQKILTS